MMDFFAAGGFQQLFSDLDEQQVDFAEVTEREQEAEAEANRGKFQEFEVMQDDSYFYVSEDINSNSDMSCFDGYNSNKFNGISCTKLIDPVYEILSSANDQITGNHLLTLENYNSIDNNNNNNNNKNSINKPTYDEGHHLDDELERSLDFLLPLVEDAAASSSSASSPSSSSSAETPSRLIQEVAEWEAQFLDNYIEIPELIDFLPDKTPLCTDTCELFLHESSKNLRLFRSKHKTRSSSALLSDLKSSGIGYPCTFGSCDKIYAKPAHLKAHLRRHLGEKPYICTWPECSWKFSRSDELARHRRSHSGVKPYKCDYCTKCFARSDHLAKHRKVHERRLLAANRAGRGCDGAPLPSSVFNVRPGRKRKNQT